MNKPRVAVVGSCVSRDIFNSSFIPGYKEHVELVGDVYQSSLPSLSRDVPVSIDNIKKFKPHYKKTISNEFDGDNMNRIIASKPDIVIMDFYADIHFGVTKINEQYVTRNHMAFMALNGADDYYHDEHKIYPDRARYEGIMKDDGYDQIATAAIVQFISRLRNECKSSQIIINSARFASDYIGLDGRRKQFDKTDRLINKNRRWQELDKVAVDITDGHQITYPDELIIGDESHRWGLNPVHYRQQYYDYLWKNIEALTD